MARIRCRDRQCTLNKGGICTSEEIEYDPAMGCLTMEPRNDDNEEWEQEEWEEEDKSAEDDLYAEDEADEDEEDDLEDEEDHFSSRGKQRKR
jgi:hypothetical protein